MVHGASTRLYLTDGEKHVWPPLFCLAPPYLPRSSSSGISISAPIGLRAAAKPRQGPSCPLRWLIDVRYAFGLLCAQFPARRLDPLVRARLAPRRKLEPLIQCYSPTRDDPAVTRSGLRLSTSNVLQTSGLRKKSLVDAKRAGEITRARMGSVDLADGRIGTLVRNAQLSTATGLPLAFEEAFAEITAEYAEERYTAVAATVKIPIPVQAVVS